MSEKIVGLKVRLKGNKENLEELAKLKKAIEDINKSIAAAGQAQAKNAKAAAQAAQAAAQATQQQTNATNQQTQATQQQTQATGQASKSLAQLRREAQQLAAAGQDYSALTAEAARLKQAQDEVNKAIRDSAKAFEESKFAAGSYRQLNAQLGELRRQYKELSAAERDAAPGREILASIQRLDTELKDLDKSIGQYQRNVGNYESAFRGLGSTLQEVSGVLGLAVGAKEILDANAQISDSIANVQKTSSLAADEVQRLTEILKQRDTRTSLADQLGIAEIGGRLGLGSTAEELAAFVSAIDTANVALGDQFNNSAEEVTDTLAGLRNVLTTFQTENVAEDVLRIGNALNVLETQGVGTAPVIADFANRIGGIGTPLGLAADQVLGLSTTLNELQITAERGGTATTRVLTELAADADKFGNVVVRAGLVGSVGEFRRLVETDLFEAFALVAQAAQESSSTNIELAQTLDELGIDGAGTTEIFAKLGSNIGLLRDRVETARVALGNTDSLIAEFNAKNTNLAASIDKLRNAFINLIVSADIQTFLQTGIELLTRFVLGLAEVPRFISENRVAITALIVALVSLNANLIAASINTLRKAAAEKAAVITTRAVTAAQWLLNAALTANPIGLVVAAVALLVAGFATLYKNSERLRDGIKNAGESFLEFYEKNRLLFGPLNLLIEGWRFLFNLFTEGPKKAFAEYKAGMQRYFDFLSERVSQAVNTVRIFGEKLKGFFTGGLDDEAEARVKSYEAAIRDSDERLKGNYAAYQKSRVDKARKADEQIIDSARRTALTFQQITLGLQRRQQGLPVGIAAPAAPAGATTTSVTSSTETQRAKKAAEARLSAAENILKLETELIQNEFDKRQRLLEQQSKKQIEALVGTPAQIAEQTSLIRQQLALQSAQVEKDRQESIDKALAQVAKYNEDLKALQVAAGKDLAQAELDAFDRSINQQQQARETAVTQSLLTLERQLAAGEIAYEDYQLAIERIERQGQQQRFAADSEAAAKRIELLSALAQQETAVAEQKAREQIQAIEQAKADELKRIREAAALGGLTADQATQAEADAEALARQKEIDSLTSLESEKLSVLSKFANDAFDIQQSLAQQELDLQRRKNEELARIEEQKSESFARFNENLGMLFGEFIAGQQRDTTELIKSTLNASLSALEAYLIAEVSARSIASAESVATFGAAGLAKAALLTGLIRGAFAGVRGIISSLEEGGTISGAGVAFEGGVPDSGGIISGPRHSQGGVRGLTASGQGVEVEGGEFFLRNGAMSHVINRKSTQRYSGALRMLQSMAPANRYSPARTSLAASINSMAVGGTISPLAITPLAAPVGASGALGAAAVASQSTMSADMQVFTSSVLDAIGAINARIDRIEVVNRPEETLIEGNKALRVINRRRP